MVGMQAKARRLEVVSPSGMGVGGVCGMKVAEIAGMPEISGESMKVRRMEMMNGTIGTDGKGGTANRRIA